MKKKFAGVLAVLMVLVMGTTTAFAADSPTAEDIYKDAIKSVLIKSDAGLSGSDDGKIVIASVNDTISKQAKAAVNKQKEKGEIIAMADVSGENITKGTLTLTLPDDTLKKSDQGNVYVLHQLPDGSWEKLIPTEVGSNYVTVELNSFSPICVVVSDVPVSNGSSGNNNGSSGGSYPVYYPVYYPSSGSNGSGDGSNSGNNSTTQPGNSNTPSSGNPSSSDDNGSYDDGYSNGYGDGYEAGRGDAKEEFENNNSDPGNSNGNNSNANNSNGNNSASGTNSSGGKTNVSTRPASGGDAVVTAPKTGASLPALPFVAVFAAAGIALCGKKARKSDE